MVWVWERHAALRSTGYEKKNMALPDYEMLASANTTHTTGTLDFLFCISSKDVRMWQIAYFQPIPYLLSFFYEAMLSLSWE